MSPEERVARQLETEKKIAEWKTNNPERAAEVDRKARENTEKFFNDRKVLKETNFDAYMAIINNEPQASRDPELYFAKEQRNLLSIEIRNDLIEKRKADHERMVAEKKAAKDKKKDSYHD